MLGKLIDRYKNYRKQSYLNKHDSYKHHYAFVGVGNHSISNLYPAIDFLGVPLKMICTRTETNATKMAGRYNGATGTDNLDNIIKNDAIKGVFVCSDPSTHYEITKKLLEGGKSVFVEKPVCMTRQELDTLTKIGNKNNCLVGVQKRYSAINKVLKKQLGDVISYNYRYVTGAYPEGDEVLDLYIHPIDNIIFLFGKIKDLSIKKAGAEKGKTTYLLLTEHASGVKGSVELSTAYSWNTPVDQLYVSTSNTLFDANYPYHLEGTSKQKDLFGIPLEKVLKRPVKKEVYYDVNGFVPIKENNSLVVQGYLAEIETFVNLVEGGKNTNLSAPQDLVETYRVMELLSSKS